MSSDPQGSNQGGAGSPPPKKSRKLLAVVAIIVVIILIGAIVGFMFLKTEHFTFTTFKGTTITKLHYSTGVQTLTGHSQWNTTYQWDVGGPMMFRQQLYNWKQNGTMSLTGVSCSVPGFTFTDSTPAIPAVLPEASSPEGGIWVDLWFDTPSSNYNGPFLYTLSIDWYPPAPIEPTRNNITFATETQMVTVHSLGGTFTQKTIIEHPEFSGKHISGAQMSLNELYRYTGSGRENITSIVANITGFSFTSSSPSLPVAMPNSTQPWLYLSMRFDTPSYQYNGSFNYTVYFDQYPDEVSPQYHHLTSVLEVQYVTTHFGSASNTVRYDRWHNETAGDYPVGRTMNITEPFWNIASGNMSITSIMCNTSGFSLSQVVPQLPVHVPNSPDPSFGNVTLVLSFTVPAAQYNGQFEYIVYFDSFVV